MVALKSFYDPPILGLWQPFSLILEAALELVAVVLAFPGSVL